MTTVDDEDIILFLSVLQFIIPTYVLSDNVFD